MAGGNKSKLDLHSNLIVNQLPPQSNALCKLPHHPEQVPGKSSSLVPLGFSNELSSSENMSVYHPNLQDAENKPRSKSSNSRTMNPSLSAQLWASVTWPSRGTVLILRGKCGLMHICVNYKLCCY